MGTWEGRWVWGWRWDWEGDGLEREMGLGWTWVWDRHRLGRDMGCMREMADALWEGHTLLKIGLSAHRHTDTDAGRQTKVKRVYPTVSLFSLGGYK